MTGLQLSNLSDSVVLHESCVYGAIQQLYPLCEAPTDGDERTWLGIQLSVCEFEAAHVAYPESCRYRNSLHACTTELASQAPWWTTFSGSYRHISTVCAEYQSTHEAELAAKLYRNLRFLTEELRDDLDDLIDSMHGIKDEARDQLQINKLFATELRDSLSMLRAFSQGLSQATDSQQELTVYLDKMWHQESSLALQRKSAHQLNMDSFMTISEEAARMMMYLSEQQSLARKLGLQQQSSLDLLEDIKVQVASMASAADLELKKVVRNGLQAIQEVVNEASGNLAQHEDSLTESFRKLRETTDQLTLLAGRMQSFWGFLWAILQFGIRHKPILSVAVFPIMIWLWRLISKFWLASSNRKALQFSQYECPQVGHTSWSFHDYREAINEEVFL